MHKTLTLYEPFTVQYNANRVTIESVGKKHGQRVQVGLSSLMVAAMALLLSACLPSVEFKGARDDAAIVTDEEVVWDGGNLFDAASQATSDAQSSPDAAPSCPGEHFENGMPAGWTYRSNATPGDCSVVENETEATCGTQSLRCGCGDNTVDDIRCEQYLRLNTLVTPSLSVRGKIHLDITRISYYISFVHIKISDEFDLELTLTRDSKLLLWSSRDGYLVEQTISVAPLWNDFTLQAEVNLVTSMLDYSTSINGQSSTGSTPLNSTNLCNIIGLDIGIFTSAGTPAIANFDDILVETSPSGTLTGEQ